MPFDSSARPQLARRIAIWILIALMPLQAMAASVLAARGPAHVHRAPSGATLAAASNALVLVDFRREAGPSMARERHLATPFGHFHGAGVVQRHHHARSDAGVVRLGDDAAPAGSDGDEFTPSPSLAAFVALIDSARHRLPKATATTAASHAAAPFRSHLPRLPERPPRHG